MDRQTDRQTDNAIMSKGGCVSPAPCVPKIKIRWAQ